MFGQSKLVCFSSLCLPDDLKSGNSVEMKSVEKSGTKPTEQSLKSGSWKTSNIIEKIRNTFMPHRNGNKVNYGELHLN